MVRTTSLLLALLLLQGCTTLVGATVGAATTVAVEVAKVPFKVAGAAIDVATDDDEEDDD